MNTTDIAHLRTCLLKSPKAKPNRKHRAETVSRYSQLRPILEPLVSDGLGLNAIAKRLTALNVLTAEGSWHWFHPQVRRAIEYSGLAERYGSALAEKRCGVRRGSGLGSTPSARPTVHPDE
jgi:hypothetical protein